MGQYVVYLCASSDNPEQADEDIEAQELAIDLFLEQDAPQPWRVIGRFTEAPADLGDERPQLEAALALVCQCPGAELLVATLDRLSGRKLSVPALLERPKVKLRVAETPRLGVSHPLAHSAKVLPFTRASPPLRRSA